MKQIIMFSTQTCPYGDAGATRLHYLAKLFELNGYTPTIVGIKSFPEENKIYEEIVDGISYRYFKSHNRYYYSQMKKYLEECFSIGAILVYSIPIRPLLFLRKYAQKKNIPIIHDSVEWYSKSEFRYPYLSYEYLRKELYNRFLIDKSFKVIGISKYLCNHFSKRKIDTVRIPVILDLKDSKIEKKINDEFVNIAYIGGYAPKKDQIAVFIKSYISLESKYKEKIHMSFIGMNIDQVAALAEIEQESLEVMKSIKCYGRLKREKLLEIMQEVDYTILIRDPEERYAQAGFPTKVVESLAAATPVIANITSDLGLYLKDGVNSFVLESVDSDYISHFLISLSEQMQFENRVEMMKMARKTAEDCFDYSLYIEDLCNLIGGNQ